MKIPLNTQKMVSKSLYLHWESITIRQQEEEHEKALLDMLDDERLQYVRLKENGGACAARNYGVDMARGEYIAFQDSDDVWHPDKLEKQYRFIEEYDLDGCYQDVKWVDSNEKLVELRSMDSLREI